MMHSHSHSRAHDTTAPMAVPMNGNIPAGWVVPEFSAADVLAFAPEIPAKPDVTAYEETEMRFPVDPAGSASALPRTEDVVSNG